MDDNSISGENMTRITNSIYSPTGYRRPYSSKQNKSAVVFQLASSNSLSAAGSPEGRCHQNIGTKMSEGLNSQINAGRWQPWDLTASNLLCGDRTFIVARRVKGSSLECSRSFHSSHKLDGLEPKSKRENLSVGAWLEKELRKSIDEQGKYRKILEILANPNFLIACYSLIKSKPGNMTPGTTLTTIDGIDLKWFNETAEQIKNGTFKFKPVRIQEIPKSNGKLRTLGISNPREKIVQKAIEMILSNIWEPEFSDASHGFRPERSVKTALKQLFLHGDNYAWVIQGDINKCFDSIPHNIIMSSLKEKIRCEHTLRLILKMLTCGSLNTKTGVMTKSIIGTPQGNIASPILANIVLDKLDQYLEEYKQKFETGIKRKSNKEYISLRNKRSYTRDPIKKKELWVLMRKISSIDYQDPNFKRMMYVRYADDFVILLTGSYEEANIIKRHVKDVLLKKTGLELNEEKTLVTSTSKAFEFLGASCKRAGTSNKLTKSVEGISRRAVPRLRIDIPIDKLMNNFIKYGICKSKDNPTARKDLVNLDHNDITAFYNSKILGITEFYNFARNYHELHRFMWLMKASCALTLALKYKIRTMRAAFNKFGPQLASPDGVKLNIPTNFKQKLGFNKAVKGDGDNLMKGTWSSKVTKSNLFKSCLLCGSKSEVEMHHVRAVKDVRQKMRTGNATYDDWMGAMNRKQIPLCKYHHRSLHAGKLLHYELKKIYEFRE
jgi:group II intron reverse transcriptase/maturase